MLFFFCRGKDECKGLHMQSEYSTTEPLIQPGGLSFLLYLWALESRKPSQTQSFLLVS